MKQIIIYSVLGLFALTLIGCGGIKTEDVKKVWAEAIDGYYADMLKADDASKVEDIQKRLDAGAKKMGAKDWTDLTTQAAKNDADGWTKLTTEMTEYTKKAGEKYAEDLKKKNEEAAKKK